jgi:hypothetical protein
MIANISPSILAIEETYNTLKYANRAKNIKINLKKNVIESDYHISKYDEVVNALRNEIEELKDQLAQKLQSQNNGLNNSFDGGSNDKTEKIIKDITNHFQEEIKLRKEIIEMERAVENIKLEISDKEWDLYKLNANETSKSNEIKKYIKTKTGEKETTEKIIQEKYFKQSELIKKRKDIQLLIKNNNKELGAKVLTNTYQYYVTLLENMTLEHRRNVNFNEIKRKDIQINQLSDQIKKRDEFIINATNEFRNKKVDFKYNNDKLKSLEYLDLQPLRLPVINMNNYVNTNGINNNDKPNANNKPNNNNNKLPSIPKNNTKGTPSPQHSKINNLKIRKL